MDEVMAELAQMTGAINTTSLPINSLQKGLTCCKTHILHGNFHIPLCGGMCIHLFICAVCLSLRLFSPWYARVSALVRSALLAGSQPCCPPNSQNPDTVSCMCFIMLLKKMLSNSIQQSVKNTKGFYCSHCLL